MVKSYTELETSWEQWKQAKLRGQVRGGFPQAEELLEIRKSEFTSIGVHAAFHLGSEKEGERWPSRPKGRKSKK